jgi:hypothetical protein
VSVSKSSTEKKNLEKKLQSQGPIDIGSQIKLMQNLADNQIKYLQSQQEIAIPGDLLDLGQTVQSENKPTDPEKFNTNWEYCHCAENDNRAKLMVNGNFPSFTFRLRSSSHRERKVDSPESNKRGKSYQESRLGSACIYSFLNRIQGDPPGSLESGTVANQILKKKKDE